MRHVRQNDKTGANGDGARRGVGVPALAACADRLSLPQARRAGQGYAVARLEDYP
jgi:hypothetical protein